MVASPHEFDIVRIRDTDPTPVADVDIYVINGVLQIPAAAIGGAIKWGRVLIVDDVNGNDSTAIRGTFASYKTIAAALAAASSGDLVKILPGTYSVAAGLTIPTGVAVRGVSLEVVTIQKLLVTADTTLVTMGESTRLEDVTLKLTSAEHHTLIGVSFPGTTSATAKLRTSVVTVDNSGAGAGASAVTGVLSSGTGAPNPETDAVRACTVVVNSTGTGKKRALLVNAANTFNDRDVNWISRGGSDSIGIESDHASAMVVHDSGTASGDTADISQTQGSIKLGAVSLVHSTANGKYFTADQISFNLVWADPGGLPVGTRYLRPGSGTAHLSDIQVAAPRNSVAKRLNVFAQAAPGVGKNTVFTVRKNGVDTALVATLSGTATSVLNEGDSVDFAKNDKLSVKIANDAASATSDVVVTVELY